MRVPRPVLVTVTQITLFFHSLPAVPSCNVAALQICNIFLLMKERYDLLRPMGHPLS